MYNSLIQILWICIEIQTVYSGRNEPILNCDNCHKKTINYCDERILEENVRKWWNREICDYKNIFFLSMDILYSITTILANENNNYHIASVLRDQMKFVYNDTFLFSLFMVTEKSSTNL